MTWYLRGAESASGSSGAAFSLLQSGTLKGDMAAGRRSSAPHRLSRGVILLNDVRTRTRRSGSETIDSTK